MKPLCFFSLVSFMICCFLCTAKAVRSLLKTDKADEAFKVTENKTNFTDIFFLKYYLDLELLRLSSQDFFSEIF